MNVFIGMYPGIDGFLRTRGSLMLDVVFVAMFAVVPLLAYSVWLARQGRFLAHRRLQVTLGTVLLVAVTVFEIDIRVNGWTERAEASPYWVGGWSDPVHVSLLIHLFFAIPSAILWVIVIVRALRNFESPPRPNQHSKSHRLWARLASFEMVMTAVTGWVFYWMAFVASA